MLLDFEKSRKSQESPRKKSYWTQKRATTTVSGFKRGGKLGKNIKCWQYERRLVDGGGATRSHTWCIGDNLKERSHRLQQVKGKMLEYHPLMVGILDPNESKIGITTQGEVTKKLGDGG